MTGTESPQPRAPSPRDLEPESPDAENEQVEINAAPSPQQPPKSVESIPESNNNEKGLVFKDLDESLKKECAKTPPTVTPQHLQPQQLVLPQTSSSSNRAAWLFLQNSAANQLSNSVHHQKFFGAGGAGVGLDSHMVGLNGGHLIAGGNVMGQHGAGGGNAAAAAAAAGYWRM